MKVAYILTKACLKKLENHHPGMTEREMIRQSLTVSFFLMSSSFSAASTRSALAWERHILFVSTSQNTCTHAQNLTD